MPRGRPKRPTNLRLDPALVAAVRERAGNLTAAVEEALRLWLTRAPGREAPAERDGDPPAAGAPDDPRLPARGTRRW